MKKLNYILALLLIVIVVIQFIPVDRTNPEFDVKYDFDAPANVKEIVVNSCYDCHSNQTKWVWYSYVAPMSWLVTDHVKDGRKHINFSEWLKKPEEKRQKIKEEMIEEIEAGNMPLPGYVMLHSTVEITDEKLQILKAWTFAEADSI